MSKRRLDFLPDLKGRVNLEDEAFESRLFMAETERLSNAIDVLEEDGYDYKYEPHGNRNAIKRVFREVERRTSSFSNIFSNVELATAESWLEAFAVYHNARQRSWVADCWSVSSSS